MSFKKPIAVGIDLGTTYSVVAKLDELDRPVTLVNSEGDLLTPSVVLFDGPDVIVGKEAQKAMFTEAVNIADCSKRELGKKLFHKSLGGNQYPPEVIEAWILNKLKMDASRQIGEFSQAVITVPAHFDEVRRNATQDAGYIAGIEVLDIINEPTAAAIAYGVSGNFLNQQGQADQQTRLLVYDLGGGTFDVTIMEINGGNFNTIATDGDVRLGGLDWDQRIVNHVREQFLQLHTLDPLTDPNIAARLWRECEDAKRTLSARQKAMITCDFQGKSLRLEVTREQFEEMTQDLLERTRFTSSQTLLEAKLEWKDIDHVLLIGGSSRMPMITKMLEKMTGKKPENSVAADEAVAHGAAIRAGLLLSEKEGRPQPIKIKNVNSHSLGVVATNVKNNQKYSAIVIPRNTTLPITAKRSFKTLRENQRSIHIQIVEGESPTPDHCVKLGECVVRDLPDGLPKGTPIIVRFRYNENGRLTIHILIEGNTHSIQHEISRENSLTREQLAEWRGRITG